MAFSCDPPEAFLSSYLPYVFCKLHDWLSGVDNIYAQLRVPFWKKEGLTFHLLTDMLSTPEEESMKISLRSELYPTPLLSGRGREIRVGKRSLAKMARLLEPAFRYTYKSSKNHPKPPPGNWTAEDFVFRGKKYSNRLPPGSLGLPLIGQSLDQVKALKTDKVEEWFHKGIAKNGPIWKANLFGYSTVQPLIKTLTFNVICSLLFGIERGPKREKFLPLFQDMIEGILAIPINLPFTQFNRGILARKKIVPMLMDLIHKKRDTLDNQKRNLASPDKYLITSFLSIRDDSSTLMSEEEIIDNIIIVMIGGYDTTSILISFLVKLLANNKAIYSNIVQ
ncbi:cytochrome P450, partial [Tanacetum coccineum]